ncbi:MAG: S1/P1 Nuclease [Idiomarinaceae bacterium HL-53]|nr:MAG: S1/P1 Nuclease [Idiomarinaceae bacterium HL-53]CUS49570.1 hypothetical protein Ga0003345_2570 [Idiomarinaceae bacterium HL-53]
MRKLASFTFVVLATLAICVPRGWSWGFQGHEYIGSVAWEYLSPEAQTWVAEHLELVDEPSLSEVVTWADRVRGTDEGLTMGPLHYANIPRGETEFVMERDCPTRRCVVAATIDTIEVMLSDTSSSQEKAEAMRAFTHWLTDLHQPLHMGYADDRGGNRIRIQFRDFETNLHSLWDTVVIREKTLHEPAQLAAQNPLPATPEDWEAAVIEWANHSAAIVRSTVYDGVESGSEIDAQYVDIAKPIIRDQLLLAAQRMAQVLEQAAAKDRARAE